MFLIYQYDVDLPFSFADVCYISPATPIITFHFYKHLMVSCINERFLYVVICYSLLSFAMFWNCFQHPMSSWEMHLSFWFACVHCVLVVRQLYRYSCFLNYNKVQNLLFKTKTVLYYFQFEIWPARDRNANAYI